MRLSKFLVVSLLALMTLSFTACSSSDDDGGKGKIERPKYLSDAARYKITTQGSTWKSLELTEDGRYFIVHDGSVSGSSSQDDDDVIVSGSYEKKGNRYVLNTVGELTITANNNSYELQLTYKGKSLKLSAQKSGTLPSNKVNDELCRTWVFSKCYIVVKYDGKKVYNASSTSANELYDGFRSAINTPEYKDKLKLSQDKMEDIDGLRLLRTVTFTHAGSYYVTTTDGREDLMNYWKWINANELIIGFSENEDQISVDDQAALKFDNGQLIMVDSQSKGREEVTLAMEFQPVHTDR